MERTTLERIIDSCQDCQRLGAELCDDCAEMVYALTENVRNEIRAGRALAPREG